MKYYAVIDTNVVVSSMLIRSSIPGKLVDLVSKGEIIPFINQEILDEYEDVLSRNDFGFSIEDVNNQILVFKEKGIVLGRTHSDSVFGDEGDVVFFEIVMTGKKYTDAYLVTGNKKHFPKETFIVTPREMLEIIERDKKKEEKDE